MIETTTYSGDGWKVLKEFEGWKIGYLRYCDRFSELTEMECHLKTDEVFVLLEGEAVLYTETEAIAMERGILYNIPKGVWHTILTTPETRVEIEITFVLLISIASSIIYFTSYDNALYIR